MKIALLCGGPSLERGISLNSARSVMDHLSGPKVEILPVYFDHKKNAYKISCAQLYSNTPSDFDFKLGQTATPLSDKALIKYLRSADIVFPAMHGPFGEDGIVQHLMEENNIPFIGTGSEACKKCFDKYWANEFIKKQGFFTLPSTVLKIYKKDHREILEKFFAENQVKRAAVKPATGGSSIGVFSVSTVDEALAKAETIFSKRMDTRVVVEPFVEGVEFTVIILQNRFDQPVALLPTEIETDYSEHQVFDFRKKYLPTRQVIYHCPPRFSNEVIEKIQVQAEQLFSTLGMQDFARFDGWLLPDGNIWFSDFNPISGMEQNSFIFQQSTRIGFTHQTVLKHILASACRRQQIELPQKNDGILRLTAQNDKIGKAQNDEEKAQDDKIKKPVNILFGGATSERQVSLMSGTNVWLKLRKSRIYEPKPFLLDTNGAVWEVPYALLLNHTVEEIMDNCEKAEDNIERLNQLVDKVKLRLAAQDDVLSEPFFMPRKMTLEEFADKSKFVFIALHGGDGENGMLQTLFEKHGVKYNGSGIEASKLCMDKFQTGEAVLDMQAKGLETAPKRIVDLSQPFEPERLWQEIINEFASKTLIIKPQGDGCSSGIVRLFSAKDLSKYVALIREQAVFIPKETFKNQSEIVQMPPLGTTHFLLEKFVETDRIQIRGNHLKHKKISGFIEITVGVLEEDGKIHAMNPSLTVAEGELLSVEEKFQGGTGINITPPPREILGLPKIEKIRNLIERFAEAIKVEGYARIDAFVNTKTGDVIIIEVNTLPGLTPSTVFYHQALAEPKSMFPTEVLEKLIENKEY
ncbi:MAG: hypothetical protein WC107_05350 [Patescibacteria group bacterium]